MKIDLIRDVCRYGGILSPIGEKYIPQSMDELNQIIRKVSSYGFTGTPYTPSFTDVNNFISFRIISIDSNILYHINMDTVYSDIREGKINQLL